MPAMVIGKSGVTSRNGVAAGAGIEVGIFYQSIADRPAKVPRRRSRYALCDLRRQRGQRRLAHKCNQTCKEGLPVIASGLSMLRRARESNTAVLAVTSYTLESTTAIVAAAERVGTPIIVQIGSSSYRAVHRGAALAAVLAAAHEASVEVGVHLDHCDDIDEITWAIANGYSSVMYDGSHSPLADNIAGTRRCVDLAHDRGVGLEAELGALAGDEDVSRNSGDAAEHIHTMTDPAEAAEFVAATNVDALAVAVGNVHGLSSYPVNLDLNHLARIARAVSVPLVLHGASGLPEDQIRGAVDLGVTKVNVNAEVRRAWLQGMREGLAENNDDDVLRFQRRAISAMAYAIEDKIKGLG
jgi:fructose-bisphosphate aldolase class II/tagatose 1,6-diphosphate aldolase GatY/KbaY